jgi:hypothetical protein
MDKIAIRFNTDVPSTGHVFDKLSYRSARGVKISRKDEKEGRDWMGRKGELRDGMDQRELRTSLAAGRAGRI